MPEQSCANPSPIDQCAARAYLYTLFAQLLGGEPSGALVEAMTSEFACQAWAIAAPDHLAVFNQLRRKAPSLRATEFTRLFVGPGPAPVPLGESFYLAPSRSLFTRTTLEVRELYRQGGYKAQDQGRIPDDHLSIELSFMAALADEEVRALEKGGDGAEPRKNQYQFIASHLGKWTPLLAQSIASIAPHSCYAVAVEALAALVASHGENLG